VFIGCHHSTRSCVIRAGQGGALETHANFGRYGDAATYMVDAEQYLVIKQQTPETANHLKMSYVPSRFPNLHMQLAHVRR